MLLVPVVSADGRSLSWSASQAECLGQILARHEARHAVDDKPLPEFRRALAFNQVGQLEQIVDRIRQSTYRRNVEIWKWFFEPKNVQKSAASNPWSNNYLEGPDSYFHHRQPADL